MKSFLFLLFPFYCLAQAPQSLEIAQLDSLCSHFLQQGQYQEALPYALAKADKLKIKNGEDSLYAKASNMIGALYYYIGNFDKCEQYWILTEQVRKKSIGTKHLDYAKSLNNLAILYADKSQYEKAEPYYRQAAQVISQTVGENHLAFSMSLNNLGIFYWKIGKYKEAEPCYLKAKDIIAKNLGMNHPDYADALDNLAILYSDFELYEQAEPLYLQAMDIREKSMGIEHPAYATSLNNLAGFYQQTKKTAQAEQVYLQALSLREKTLGTESPDYLQSLNNLASAYFNNKKYKEAEELYLQVKGLRAKQSGTAHPDYAATLYNLSFLYQKTARYEEAEKHCLQALGIYKNLALVYNPTYIKFLNSLTEIYICTNKWDKALINNGFSLAFNAGKDSLAQQKVYEHWIKNLQESDYISYPDAQESLKQLSKIMANQPSNTLQEQYQIARLALELARKARDASMGDKNKLYQIAQHNHWFGVALDCAFSLAKASNDGHFRSEAFGFAEQGKSVLLAQAIQNEKAYHFGDLPDSLVRQEKQLHQAQSEITAAMLEAKAEEKVLLRNQLNELNAKMKSLKEKLEKDYPRYNQLKYAQNQATIPEIQQKLEAQTAVVEYALSQNTIYIFYIDKNNFRLFDIPLAQDSLSLRITALRKALSHYNFIQQNPDEAYVLFVENAAWFYDNLLKSVLAQAQDIQHLILIPDGELAHLPFEVFLSQKPVKNTPYSDLDYLIKKYRISYNYSASLWKENSEGNAKSNNGQILAMAAGYAPIAAQSASRRYRTPQTQRLRDALQALPEVSTEIKAIGALLEGDFLLDTASNEAFFKQNAHQYSIIHLAMHGVLNKKEPLLSSLAFTETQDSSQDNFLQAYEISQLQLNADLVVLSACETGFGKFEKGEGVMSLARSFMYAGVSALVVSLWEVNDASTGKMMQFFYKNMAEGMGKAEALQQAKIQYLSASKGIAAHPAYWSAFIQMGDAGAIRIQQKSSFFWLWIGLGISILATLGFLFIKKSK